MTPPVSGTSGTGRQEALPDIRVFVSPLDPLLAVTKLLDVVVMVTNVLEDNRNKTNSFYSFSPVTFEFAYFRNALNCRNL